MSRMNGQYTFQSPQSNAALGDDTSSTATLRIFTAIERCTVVEVGAVAADSAHVPSSAFSFRALKRTGGVAANDVVVDLFTAAFAAEGGVAGDPSTLNFNNANAIPSGVVTNLAAGLTAGKALRAFCEVSLDKGDQIVLDVVAAGGASSTAVFYAKVFPNGAGLVEANDVDSN